MTEGPEEERIHMNTKPIDSFLRACADARLEEFLRAGHAEAGHNGPYRIAETPARNTSHWLITCAYLWKTTGEEKYRTACRGFREYLLGEQKKSASGAIRCLDDPKAADSINGTIGQAWVIEGLTYAYDVFGEEACLDGAFRIFRSQIFDPETGFWKRTAPDGQVLGYDLTVNHQVWFCYAGLLLLKHRKDEEIRKQTERFLEGIRNEYFGIHGSGLIRHFGRMTRLRPQFAKHYAKQYAKYIGLALKVFDEKKVDLIRQEEGYHVFELFGYALIARLCPDEPLFRSPAFRKALDYGTDTERLNRILKVQEPERMNPYAYGYNSPAFEIPVVEMAFRGTAEEEKVLGLLELQKRLTWNGETRMLDRGTDDAATLTARIYEYVHFCDLCRERNGQS